MKPITVFLALFLIEIMAETGFRVNTKIIEGFSLKNIMLYGAAAFAIGKIMSSSGRSIYFPQIKRFNRIYIFLLLFAIFSVVYSMFLSMPGYQVLRGLILVKSSLLDGFLCFFVFMFFLSRDERQAPIMMNMMLFIVTIYASLTLIEVLLGIPMFGLDGDSNRPNGPLGEPNQTAAVLAVFIPLSASMVFVYKKWLIFYVGSAFLLTATIIVTGSRGGLLAASVGMLFWFFALRKEMQMGPKLMMFIFGPIIAMASFLVLPEYYQELFFERLGLISTDVDVDEVSAGRTMIWRNALDLFYVSPIFGIGWSGYKMVVGAATHNVYLEYLINLGIIGLCVYLSFWYRMYAIINDKKIIHTVDDKYIMVAVKAGLFALLTSIFFVNLYTPFLVVWAYLGVAAAMANIRYLQFLFLKKQQSVELSK